MNVLLRILKIIGLFVTLIVALAGIVGIGLFVATSGSDSVPATVADDATLPRVELDGQTFHAETFGDNPAASVTAVREFFR